MPQPAELAERGPGLRRDDEIRMKIYAADKSELMQVSRIERQGSDLVLKGKVFGTMPMSATLTPEQARAAFKLLTPRLILFLLTLPFRKGSK